MSFMHPHPADYHFIVIGNPIAHSKSPELHQAFAKQTGLNISYARQLCPNNYDSFIAVVEVFFNGGGTGANVTVPFKEIAFELCQKIGKLSEYAQVAGAVNTLAIKDGGLYGDNTDGRGLVADLRSKGVDLSGKNVAILGAGGATRGAILPLLEAGASITIFNRTLEKAQNLVEMFTPFIQYPNQFVYAEQLCPKNLTGVCDIMINATSAGTTGQTLKLDESDMVVMDVAYDMMYGKPTEFSDYFGLHQQRNPKTFKCFDGLGMLVNQGALSFELWTGKQVDLDTLGNPFA